ncbi:DinB family protein [Marinoscillum sp.]|uniref:DinB family protein n=1 Tax=Marinoscillum sp. TaxID=2024838 RepID=UPI003BAA1EA9
MSINQSAINLLDQLQDVVDQFSAESFSKPVPTLSNSSVGQHVRHTLEFFICLMDAENDRAINYDQRKHDPFIEKDPKLASDIIDTAKDFFAQECDDFALVMEANYEIDKDETTSIPSSYLRELAYNIEHAIHHMALIKVGVKSCFPGINLPDHFGVASSTVRYQKSQNA